MSSKQLLCFFLMLSFFQIGFTQEKSDSLVLPFNLKFDNSKLLSHKTYISNNQDTLSIDLFRFYVSNIEIQFSDKSIFKPANSYHLIAMDDPNSLQVSICKNENKIISKISFSIGIDSTTSVSGALSSDLDPTKGMYWAWQSGYINMKIEGKSSSCLTRKNEFQFHIGGYLYPYYAIRKIVLYPNKEQFEIAVDLGILFSNLKLSETNSIMIPSKIAMDIANFSQSMFTIE